MTPSPFDLDAALWVAALVLAGWAAWLTRPRDLGWSPDVFFAGVWGELLRPAPLPLREGPIPPEGWHGRGRELGPEHDPAVRLGPACAWELLPAWGPEVDALLRRRLGHVTAVWLEPPALTLPGVATRAILAPAAIEATLAELCDLPDARLIFFARHEVGPLLRLLHREPGTRDRVRAVVLVGAELDAERAWLAEHFTHEAFDLEMARPLRFLTLRLAEGGPQALREPPRSNRHVVDVYDLGVIPAAALDDPALGRALVALLAALE